MEHTTLAGSFVLVVACSSPSVRRFQRALEGAGACVQAASLNSDALSVVEDAQFSSAILEHVNDIARTHAMAQRLVELRIPFVVCSEASENVDGLISPILFRPIVDAELIAVLGCLHEQLTKPVREDGATLLDADVARQPVMSIA